MLFYRKFQFRFTRSFNVVLQEVSMLFYKKFPLGFTRSFNIVLQEVPMLFYKKFQFRFTRVAILYFAILLPYENGI